VVRRSCSYIAICASLIFIMSSVADELAALRKQSLTKAHASKLKDANGLSTPEQEAEALKESKKKTSIKTYKKDAVETLNKGTNAVDQDMQVRLNQIALKKQDMEKKKEATKNLQAFKGATPTSKADAALTAKTDASLTSKTDAALTSKADAALTSKTDAAPASKTEAVPAPVPAPAAVSVPEESNENDDVPDLDDIPEIESRDDAGAEPVTVPESTYSDPAAAAAARVPNRAEKKARKVMERLGMKPVVGIMRVTLKMHGNQGFFTIFQPDVFEKSGSYIVFGEARQGSGIPSPQSQAAKRVTAPVAIEKKEETVVEVEEEVDETGVEAKDIELVISQVGCSRAKAVQALKGNGGDLVNAIMSLTN
jgi:nascent polypeptide-associated complex subunit alpha